MGRGQVRRHRRRPLPYLLYISPTSRLYLAYISPVSPRYGATGVDLSREADKEVRKPARVLGLGGARNNVVVLAAGVKHMLAITDEGKMYSWGDGSCGRLGHGDHTTVSEPRLLSTLKSHRMRCCAAGEEHSLAAAADGALFSWGSGSFGISPLHLPCVSLSLMGLGLLGQAGAWLALTLTLTLPLTLALTPISGKLGHGEPVDESTPRPVAAIKHQVLEMERDVARYTGSCALEPSP